jgi:hypothetical protein
LEDSDAEGEGEEGGEEGAVGGSGWKGLRPDRKMDEQGFTFLWDCGRIDSR